MKKILTYGLVALLSGLVSYKYGINQTEEAEKDKPILTTAGIVHICPSNKIALIERGKAPKGTAMFGGHVEAKESPAEAFKRELKEELNIEQITFMELVGVYGKYGRDPRQHSVEITYTCSTHDTPSAGSDAKSVKLYEIPELRTKLSQDSESFAFDHGEILSSYLVKLDDCNPCEKACEFR